MNAPNCDLLYYRVCCDLFGNARPLSVGKRNGIAIAFAPSPHEYDTPRPAASFEWLDTPKYYVNLNELERRTWRQVLSGLSISAIARNESVSRQAIYTRLIGTRDRGGMIQKNYWVLIWCVARDLYPRRKRTRLRSSHAETTPGDILVGFPIADGRDHARPEPQYL